MDKHKKKYVSPKIIEVFSEHELLDNINGLAADWQVHPPEGDPPIWQVITT